MSQTGSNQLTDTPVTRSSGKTATPPRLCYVDDSRTSAYVVKRMLRPYGYSVDHYESAEPALVALVQDNYDLLLTDLKVSQEGMDGDDLVRALRNSGHDKISDMPIIVITGTSDTAILDQVYEAGANHILTKPVNGDELDAHIRKLVYTHTHTEHESLEQKKEGLEGATVEGIDDDADTSGFDIDSIPMLETEDVIVASARPKKAVKKKVVRKDTAKNMPAGKQDDRRNLGPARATPPDAAVSTDEAEIAQPRVARTKTAIKPRTKSVNLSSKARPGAAPTAAANAQSVVRNSSLAEKQKQALNRARAASIAKQAIAKQVAARTGQAAGPAAGRPAVNRMSAQGGAGASSEVNDKAEALRKVKAAIAAKKARLAQQQKAVEAQLQRDQAEKENHDAMAAIAAEALGEQLRKNDSSEFSDIPAMDPADELQLAPLDDIPQQPQIAAPVRQAPPVNQAVPAAANQQQAPNQPIHPSQGLPPGGNNKVEDVLAAFQQTAPSQTNILTTMEQYPLVEADMSRNYSPSRMLRMVNAILELYGPKRIMTSVMLMGMVFVLYGAWSSVFDEGLPVDVTVVGQGEIFQSITVPGRVVSKLRVNMTPSIAGRITNVYVEEGDHVKSGDLLARLDDREAKSYLKRASANLESAKEDVILAERSLTRLRQAFEKGAIARQLVEDAEVELRSATAHEGIAAEEVRTAKLSLENPRVVAPFAGTVTARFIEVGQWVVPSETLFSLVDEKQREIEVQVDAADSGGIAIGQTVNVSSDAFPGLDWSESVTRLAAAASNVGNANTVSVYVSLGNSAPSLRFGQQVDSDIRTSWNPNALKIPYGAIVNRNGNAYVIVIEEGRAQYVPVETGIEDFSHVEILQGVNIGQTVVLVNGQDIDNGQRIFLASNNR